MQERNELPALLCHLEKHPSKRKGHLVGLEAITAITVFLVILGNEVVVVRIRFEIISHRRKPANFYIYASLETDEGFKTIAREVERFRREKFTYDTVYINCR